MRRLLHCLLPACFGLLLALAAIGVKPMCTLLWYQPEVPAALKR
jgi:cyclic lactone autoinducer peptide